MSLKHNLFKKIIHSPITSHLLDYITTEFQSIIPCENDLPTNITPLRTFIESVVNQSKTDTGTLVSTLSFARRLKKILRKSKGMECTRHRIFLASLIITHKNLHDHALKNKHWLPFCDMFTAHEVNLMEKQLLQLLDYDLRLNDFEEIQQDILRIYAREYLMDSLPSDSYLPTLPFLIPSIL
ncbi:unnamed protein product [Rhizopus stolonifer]